MNSLAYDFLIPILIAIGANMFAMRTRAKLASLVVNTIAFMFIAIICVVALSHGETFSFSGIISVSHLSLLFTLLFAVSFCLISLIAYDFSRSYTSLSMLLWFSMLGGFIVASSINLMPIALGLELITMSSAFMILLDGKHRAEATIKFFIVGSIAVAFFLFATALAFPYDSSLGLSTIAGSSGYVALAAILMFIAALGFEGAIFPFNFWAPDVYEGAPGFVTPVLSGVNKKVAFLALILVLFNEHNNGKGYWSVAVRRQMDSLVFNGYMGAGDSMAMPNPISAGGIGPAMVAGILAGENAAEAVHKGNTTSSGLWNYNVEFNESYGHKTAGLEVFRVYLQSLNNDLINYGMKNFLSTKEAEDLSYGRVPELSLASKFKMVLKGASNVNAFANLVYVVRKMKELNEIYANYPKSPEGFEKWREVAKAPVEDAKARFRPSPV